MNENKDLARPARWYAAAAADTLAVTDRNPLHISRQATRVAKTDAPPPSTYDPESYPVTIPNNPYAAMESGKFHWVSPQTSNLVPIASDAVNQEARDLISAVSSAGHLSDHSLQSDRQVGNAPTGVALELRAAHSLKT